MILRPYAVIAVTVVAVAACGSHPAQALRRRSSPAAPLSCSQRYEDWKHGPAQLPWGMLTATLRKLQAARRSGSPAALRLVMSGLTGDTETLARHPLPHCVDPSGLYGTLLKQLYTAGAKARSAKGHRELCRAAVLLERAKETSHRLTAEIDHVLAEQP